MSRVQARGHTGGGGKWDDGSGQQVSYNITGLVSYNINKLDWVPSTRPWSLLEPFTSGSDSSSLDIHMIHLTRKDDIYRISSTIFIAALSHPVDNTAM